MRIFISWGADAITLGQSCLEDKKRSFDVYGEQSKSQYYKTFEFLRAGSPGKGFTKFSTHPKW